MSFTFATQFSMLPSVKLLFDFYISVEMAKTDFFFTAADADAYFIYLLFFLYLRFSRNTEPYKSL